MRWAWVLIWALVSVSCSFGTVSSEGVHGFACFSGKLERCYAKVEIPATPEPGAAPTPEGQPTPTPAMQVCERISGGDMSMTGWGTVSAVVSSITAMFIAHPIW